MLRNYLLTAWRLITKNRLFTSINAIGLAVSISCTMLIYLYVKHELTFDEFHEDIERLYVLGEGSKEGSELEASYYQTVYPIFPVMLETFPEIETGTRYFDWEEHILLVEEKKFMHQIFFVDSTFLQTLSFPLIQGDAGTVLQRKDQIVISAQIALKFFGRTDVMGEVVELEDGNKFTISGVLGKIPSNSSIQPEVLLSLMAKETDDTEFMEMANWYNTIAQVVIKLKPNADPNLLREKLSSLVKLHYDPAAKDRTLKIYPLADLRQSLADNEIYVYGLMTIGIFILLVAVINFMNLSIAASLNRLRETGMRKIMGSSRNAIVFQFFMEAFLLTLFAIILSFGLLYLMLPLLNNVLGISLDLSGENLSDISILSIILSLAISLVAGGYPAAYLSSFKTVNAVKGVIPNYKGKATLRNTLVVVQFIASVTMMIGAIVTTRQIKFMKSADLKFNRENVLVVNMDAGFKDEKAARARLKVIINELESRADIISISLSQTVPGRYGGNYNRFLSEGGNPEGISLRKAYVDDRYIDTYGIKVLRGQNFSDEYADSSNMIMLNAAALKALGWDSTEGKVLKENGTVQEYTVAGVFDDFHYRSLEGTVEPLVHFHFDKIEYTRFLSIRYIPGKAPDVVAFLQDQWKSLDTWLGFSYFFVDQEFDLQYKAVERTLMLIIIFAFVAIVISCAGIFALSAIAAQHRTKEIGIRKVLGASVPGIVGLLSMDFLKLVIVAVIVAAPLAWYGMSEWLKGFAYKVSLDWWIFMAAGCLALIIAFLTTGLQSIKAALNNPVKSLHND